MNIVLWVVAVLLILVGIAGTILPALPGAPLVFVGLLIAAWIDGFQKVGGLPLTILGVLTILSLVADVVAAAFGAKRIDASRQALVGAVVGTLFGLFAGIPSLIIGPFAGGAIGEYIARRDLLRAGQVGLATWIGIILAAAAKLTLCFLMVGIFIIAYVWK